MKSRNLTELANCNESPKETQNNFPNKKSSKNNNKKEFENEVKTAYDF